MALLTISHSVTAAAAPLSNQLHGHPSPYLALHGQDPVAWQEWNADTIARAKRENKLLFVSIGYFSCHWCHVMQKESYRDPAIAALLNRHFIPVKVDRELNGALDAALLEFSERMNGISGWPLNAFVSPNRHPVFVVLYKPPGEFKAMLESLSKHWQDNAERIQEIARQAADRPTPPPALTPPNLDRLRRATDAFLRTAKGAADVMQGGFGQVSKFPQSPQLALLLELQANRPEARQAEFLRLTLDQMARLGLRDHINGGFFRYTVDPDWATPHFEKMLYDNAQLAMVYQRAAEVLKRPEYGRVAQETLDFMLAALAGPSGGFQTSTSALDAQGDEGGAYLWEAKELRRRLSTTEYDLVRRVWGLDSPSPFEHGHLPMERAAVLAGERAALDAIHAKLRTANRLASVPRDAKFNAGLNGLALSALSRAGRGVARHEQASRRLHAFIARQLIVDGRLLKARAGGRIFPAAELDDYAYVINGLIDYSQAFKDPDARRLAIKLTHQAWPLFFGKQGWRRETTPLLATIRPEAALSDDATPSASAMLILATHRLGVPGLRANHDRALAMALSALGQDPFSHASNLTALLAAQPAPRR